MQRLVETDSPPEAARFEQLNPTDVEQLLGDSMFWDFVISQFDERDNSAQLLARREELLDILLERPAEAFMTEATNLAATCYADRAVPGPDGSRVFFTRDNKASVLDSMTTIRENEAETVIRHRMFTPLDSSSTSDGDYLTEIIASSSGEFRVYANTEDYTIHGLREVTGTPEAREIMKQYFVLTLRAAYEVNLRDLNARVAADKDAKKRYYDPQNGLFTVKNS